MKTTLKEQIRWKVLGKWTLLKRQSQRIQIDTARKWKWVSECTKCSGVGTIYDYKQKNYESTCPVCKGSKSSSFIERVRKLCVGTYEALQVRLKPCSKGACYAPAEGISETESLNNYKRNEISRLIDETYATVLPLDEEPYAIKERKDAAKWRDEWEAQRSFTQHKESIARRTSVIKHISGS